MEVENLNNEDLTALIERSIREKENRDKVAKLGHEAVALKIQRLKESGELPPTFTYTLAPSEQCLASGTPTVTPVMIFPKAVEPKPVENRLDERTGRRNGVKVRHTPDLYRPHMLAEMYHTCCVKGRSIHVSTLFKCEKARYIADEKHEKLKTFSWESVITRMNDWLDEGVVVKRSDSRELWSVNPDVVTFLKDLKDDFDTAKDGIVKEPLVGSEDAKMLKKIAGRWSAQKLIMYLRDHCQANNITF